MFPLDSAIELVEKLTNLKIMNRVSITVSNLIKEEMLSYFNLHPASAQIKRNEILSDQEIDSSVFDVLGEYDPDKRQITIYREMIKMAVQAMGDKDIDIDSLTDVVLFHEVTHAVTHIGEDREGRIWDKFVNASNFDKELFAQLYPYVLFNNFKAFSQHLYVFSTLCKYQSKKYSLWIMLKDLTLNEINKALSSARQNNIPFPDFFVERHRSGGIPLVAEVASWFRVHADGSCYRFKLNLNKIPTEKPSEPKDIQILRLITESSSKIPHEKLLKARRLLPELEKYLENSYKESALFRIIETLIDFDDGITEKVSFPKKASPGSIYALYNASLPLLYTPVPCKIFGPRWAMDATEESFTIFWGGKLWGTWTSINYDWEGYKDLFDELDKLFAKCLENAE